MAEPAVLEVPGELRPSGGWGHLGEVAIRKARRRMPGWTPFKWQRIGDDAHLFRGGVETVGKNGKPKWPKPHGEVVVTNDECRAEEERYEREHGRCRTCFGTGQEWIGWSVHDGDKHRSCRRCNATGRPRAAATAPSESSPASTEKPSAVKGGGS